MVYTLLLALLLQDPGPKNLQVGSNVQVKPALVVPSGTTIPVELVNSISTKFAKNGDGVYAKTTFPITINNQIAIPVGTSIKGRITEVTRPGRVKGKAELTISFQQIIFPNGNTMALYATLGSVGETGVRKGETTIEGEGTKGQDAGTVAATAGQGAIIGGLGARTAKGAGIGAGAGAAVGTAIVLLTRGKDVVLHPGTTLEIVLDRPIEP
jgi:type IV secretion system protein VirB10